jgi:beta-fructofuranosidase
MFSPQGLAAQGYHNRNLFQSGYLLGDWQPGQPFVREGEFVEMDHGHDFYAPQSFLPDGRRIVIGWLDMWESPLPEQQDGWAGMLSLPRELSLSADNRLQMRPAKEVECLRGPGSRGRSAR